MRRVLAQHPMRLKLEHFLFRFGKRADAVPDNKKEITEKSKKTWFALVGLDKPKTRKPPSNDPGT